MRDLKLRNVEFRGLVPPEKMSELYDQADIFLNSSNIDNMPGSILDAFAAGMPVVTTSAGGITCIVTHERTGLLVPKNNERGDGFVRDPIAGVAGVCRVNRAQCTRGMSGVPVGR